jgi:aminomethyltransferase
MLKRTPLFESHKKLAAKFTGFGGWEMPVQYSGLVDEHNTVRTAIGIFDVSHMGELRVRGKNSLDFLQFVATNDLSVLTPGKAQYNLLLNESGGVVDDIIVYQMDDNDYFICVNASNTEKDFAWLCKNNNFGVEIENLSSDYAQIALQGPKSKDLLSKIFGDDFERQNFPAFTFKEKELRLSTTQVFSCLIARTGYTGEDGFEIFYPTKHAADLWDLSLELGRDLGIKPAGLGARDTLRLEACYPLHGHEITDDITPLSAGLSWAVKLASKGSFLGREALERQQKTGVDPVLVGLEVTGQGIIREHTPLFSKDGEKIGWVTSGTKPPTLGKAVGLGFVPAIFSTLNTELEAEVRDRKFAVRVIKKPFYKR